MGFNVIIKETFSYIILPGILQTNSKQAWEISAMAAAQDGVQSRNSQAESTILCRPCSFDMFLQCYLYLSWHALPLSSTDTMTSKNGCRASGPVSFYGHVLGLSRSSLPHQFGVNRGRASSSPYGCVVSVSSESTKKPLAARGNFTLGIDLGITVHVLCISSDGNENSEVLLYSNEIRSPRQINSLFDFSVDCTFWRVILLQVFRGII